MGAYKLIGGDFKGCAFNGISKDGIKLLEPIGTHFFRKTFKIPAEDIKKVELVTEENKKKVLGTLGGGVAGGLLLGPVGMLAGLLVGGNKKEVCFICYLKDGKKLLFQGDNDFYKECLALSM